MICGGGCGGSVGMDSLELWFPPCIFFSPARVFFPLFFPSFFHFNRSVRCGWFLLTVAKVSFLCLLSINTKQISYILGSFPNLVHYKADSQFKAL
jgi:hypothetical protein